MYFVNSHSYNIICVSFSLHSLHNSLNHLHLAIFFSHASLSLCPMHFGLPSVFHFLHSNADLALPILFFLSSLFFVLKSLDNSSIVFSLCLLVLLFLTDTFFLLPIVFVIVPNTESSFILPCQFLFCILLIFNSLQFHCSAYCSVSMHISSIFVSSLTIHAGMNLSMFYYPYYTYIFPVTLLSPFLLAPCLIYSKSRSILLSPIPESGSLLLLLFLLHLLCVRRP